MLTVFLPAGIPKGTGIGLDSLIGESPKTDTVLVSGVSLAKSQGVAMGAIYQS